MTSVDDTSNEVTWFHGILEFAMAGAKSNGGVARVAAQPSAPKPASAGNELTIEQPAATVGMSVRNIRNHHTRGLLPPPEVRARVGYYNAEHVARLRRILDLQAGGDTLPPL